MTPTKTIECSRAHALRVAAVALQISDNFLSPMEGKGQCNLHRDNQESNTGNRTTNNQAQAASKQAWPNTPEHGHTVGKNAENSDTRNKQQGALPGLGKTEQP